MRGNVHPNPCPIFSCSACAGNVTWRGRSVQSCTCSNWIYLKCSLLSSSRFRTLGRSHSWSFPPCCVPVFLEIPHLPAVWLPPRTPAAGGIPPLLNLAHVASLLLMQHLHPTLAFKLLILFPPTLYLLPLHPHYLLMLLAISLYLLLPLPLPNSLRIFQWNAGGLQAKSTELLHFLSSHLVDLICIQESNLNLSSSFRIAGFSALRSDGSQSRSVVFLLMSQTLAAASSFSSGRTYPSLSFLPPLFLRLTPNLIMWRSTSL